MEIYVVVFLNFHRGIRQGCHISLYLFIIADELLANDSKKDIIKGI